MPYIPRIVLLVIWVSSSFISCKDVQTGLDGANQDDLLQHDTEPKNEEIDQHDEEQPSETTYQEGPDKNSNDLRTEIHQVFYAQNMFVAVGSLIESKNGDVLGSYQLVGSSPNGRDWTLTNLGKKGTLSAITYGNEMFLAVGNDTDSNPTVISSADGMNWIPQETDIDGLLLYTITYGNGIFVAMGNNLDTVVAYLSQDGSSWQTAELGPYWWQPRLIFDGVHFIAYGDSGVMSVSTNGTSWDHYTANGISRIFSIQEEGENLIASAEYDCCFGELPEQVKFFKGWLSSGEEIDNFLFETVDKRFGILQMATNGSLFVGAGYEKLYATTEPLKNWEWELVPLSEVAYYFGVIYGKDTFVAAMANGVLVSEDGQSWAKAEMK